MNYFLLSATVLTTLSGFAQTPLTTRQSNWQQQVDYTISVTLNDVEHTLSASEKIVYTNNSPNELKELYFHLWSNAYKNDETAFARQELENGSTDFYFSKEEDRGWIDSLNFLIDGQQVKWYFLDHIDICKIELTKPLKSGQSIEITTPFKVKLPKVFSRMGHEDQTYCITQWYPKPAVYDVNGWNYFPYLNQGEFYSEFGKFDVSISVPKNYVVAATGNLQNKDEMEWLLSKSVNRFNANTCTESSNPKSDVTYKTLRYVQDNVHDFAWFCDKRFSVERSEVILPKSGKKVTTWFFEICPKTTAVHWVDTAILFYSEMLGEYPYQQATAVVTPLSAGGGMEYPTITNITSKDRGVIVHEVGHNWFYGILANNERMYPWMDESFNNYYESRSHRYTKPATHKGIQFGRGDHGLSARLGESAFGLLQLEYLLTARKNDDQPVAIPSEQFTDKNYGSIVYGKAALMFHHLQTYLGDSLFDAMMQSYYEKWKFKHPLPNDFIDHAKQFTGKDLDWFFVDMMNEVQKPDYRIVSVKGEKITIKNKSSLAAPFPVSSMKDGEVLETRWYEGFTGKKTISFGSKTGQKLRLDAYESSMDIYRNNNTIRTKGLFKKVEPIQFKLFVSLENPYKTQIFYTPIIGGNLYNKTMLGMAFYNGLFPQTKFDYVITPMYSFGTKDIVGYYGFERHFITYGLFKEIHLALNGSRFGYEYSSNPATYNKIAPALRFDLTKQNKRSTINQSIQFRSVFLIFNENKNSSGESYAEIKNNYQVDEASYLLVNKKAINKNSLSATLQRIDDKGVSFKAFVEYKQAITYDKPKKKLDIRIFGGMFLQADKNMPGEYQFRLSGNKGQYDYLFDHALMGRSETDFDNGLFTRQLVQREGNMLMPQAITNSDSWMVSTNLVSTIPGPIPIRVFADLGCINNSVYAPQTNQTTYEVKFQYVAGLKLVVAEDIFEVNFPLFYSSDFDTAYESNDPNYKDRSAFEKLGKRITFVLNLNRLNPIKIIRTESF